jgi:hypothetical protein
MSGSTELADKQISRPPLIATRRAFCQPAGGPGSIGPMPLRRDPKSGLGRAHPDVIRHTRQDVRGQDRSGVRLSGIYLFTRRHHGHRPPHGGKVRCTGQPALLARCGLRPHWPSTPGAGSDGRRPDWMREGCRMRGLHAGSLPASAHPPGSQQTSAQQ